MILNNKKGAVNIILIVGVVILMILILVMGIKFLSNMKEIKEKSFGEKDIITKDIGLSIDAAFAAPEDVIIKYNLPDTGKKGIKAIIFKSDKNYQETSDTRYKNVLLRWSTDVTLNKKGDYSVGSWIGLKDEDKTLDFVSGVNDFSPIYSYSYKTDKESHIIKASVLKPISCWAIAGPKNWCFIGTWNYKLSSITINKLNRIVSISAEKVAP